MDIYRETILDHYKHPRNFGHLDNPDVTSDDHNVSCGDRIVMEIKYKNFLTDIKFSGEGCAISQASASMLTEKVKGMKISDITKIKTDDMMRMLGTSLTPTRVKCAVLPLEVLTKAIWTLKTQK